MSTIAYALTDFETLADFLYDWVMDDDAADPNVEDIINGANMTASTNTNNIANATGKIDGSLDFKSTNQADITIDIANSTGTICQWSYKTTNAGSWKQFFGMDDGTCANRMYLTDGNGDKPHFAADGGVGGSCTGGFYDTTVPLNQWNFYCLVQHGSKVELFLNGVSDGNTTCSKWTGNYPGATFNVNTDCNNNDGDNRVDETMVFGRALTTVEINELLDCGDDGTRGRVCNAVVDTCTYSSGDWVVDCSDNCVITTNTDLSSNTLRLNGTGNFTVLANVTADTITRSNGCRLITDNGDSNRLSWVNG